MQESNPVNGKSKKEKLSLWDSRRQDRFIDEELDHVAGRLVFYINLAVPSPDNPSDKTEDNVVTIHAADLAHILGVILRAKGYLE